MERIGIYGGTFNPPHSGHIRGAQCALEALGLDRLLVIPDRIAPHKVIPANSPTPEQRLRMLELAAAGIPKLQVSDLELKREGPSYTWETVAQVHCMYPDAKLFLLMGTDMFLTFHQWRNPEKIWENAAIAVLYRGEKGEEQEISKQKANLKSLGAQVHLIQNPVTAISSTDLRRMLVFRCAAPFLPGGVDGFIRENALYDTAQDYRDLTIEKLTQAVTGLVKPSRVNHILGCRDTAVALAKRWGADETDAARAGVLHDVTKALPSSCQLTLCSEYGILLDNFFKNNPKTLHAFTGSLVAERIFRENPAVVSAIRHHTTGKAGMNLLEKIVYVADYMEPNRDFPGVEKLRTLAFQDLDGALKLGLEMTVEMLTQQGRTVSPESLQALAELNARQ